MKRYCYNPKRTLTVLLGSVGVATALTAAPHVALADTVDTNSNTATATDALSEKEKLAAATADASTGVQPEPAATNAAGDKAGSSATPSADEPTSNDKAEGSAATDTAGATETTKPADENSASKLSTEEPTIPERTIDDTSAVIGTKMDDTHVLDANGGKIADGTNVTLWDSNAGFNQKWDVSYDQKTGYYYVAMHNTNQVLDIMYGSNKPGAKVTTYHKTGADNQLWAVEEKDGYYRFISKLDNNLVLNISGANNSNGAQLIVWIKTGKANEWFRFLPLNPEVEAGDTIDDGLYTISAGKDKNTLVVSTAYSEQATLSKAADTSTQRIFVKSDGKGYYNLIVSSTGLYLGAKDGNLVATTPVVQSAQNGSNAQKWALKQLSGGGYALINKANGLALDVMYNSLTDGSRLDTYYQTGSINQTFFFNKVANPATNASSVIIEDGSYLLQSKLDRSKVIGTQGDSKQDARVVVKSNAQFGTNVFVFKRVGDSDYYTIGLSGTNKVLDVQYNLAADAANLDTYAKTGADNQLWRIVKLNGAYSFISKLRPDLAIDLYGASAQDGNQVIVYRANGNANQLFNLISATPNIPSESAVIKEGVYNFNIGGKDSTYLDVAGQSQTEGGNILGYVKTGGNNQKFYLKKANNKNQYNIISINSGMLLDVSHSYLLPGTNVLQWSANGGDNQKWAAVANEGGTYSFVNVATGLYLALDGTLKSGNNVVGAAANSASLNQRFKLDETQFLNDGIYEIKSLADLNKALDITGGSNRDGAKLELWKDNNGLNQRYQLVFDKTSGVYRIRTGASGGWLTTENNSLKSGVVQKGNSKSATTDNNSWKPIWNGNFFSLQNVATGGVLALTGTYDGALLNTIAATGSKLQHFLFTATGLLQNGLYQLVNKANNNVLDVSGDARYAGVNVGTYGNHKSGNQKFYVTAYGDAYTIEGAVAKKNVGVSGSSTTNGANIVLDNKDYASDQLWTAEIADGGGVVFVNKKSGLALTASGSNVVQKSKDVSSYAADVWSLVETMLTGWNWEGVWRYYYEDGSSAQFTNAAYNAYNRIQGSSSSTQYLIAVDRANFRTIVFQGYRGNWIPIKDWLNAVGSSRPGFGVTASGEFSILKKGYVMGNDPDYYYWSEYWVPSWSPDGEGQRFHSIAYYRNTNFAVFDGRLGSALTHGCVRMDTENVKWIYYNAPIGTKVIIW